MRLFQNVSVYPGYLPFLDAQTGRTPSHSARLAAYLADRNGAVHILDPILRRQPDSFLAVGDDPVQQAAWARENGMKPSSTRDAILLAQIEAHRTEVFYNMHPLMFGPAFLARLPGCVKVRLAWRAAPSGNADLGGYRLLLCNFAGILRQYRERGWPAAWFSPAHDPAMDSFAANRDRPIDVAFVGGYSRHHQRRAEVIERVAALAGGIRIAFHLDRSRFTRLAESPLGLVPPLVRHRRPRDIRRISQPPLYGSRLYDLFSRSKIVLNGAVDMAGDDRGNQRCWEALGCGALMVSDDGRYPRGFAARDNFMAYASPEAAAATILAMLERPDDRLAVAARGHAMIARCYSKAAQWRRFQELTA